MAIILGSPDVGPERHRRQRMLIWTGVTALGLLIAIIRYTVFPPTGSSVVGTILSSASSIDYTHQSSNLHTDRAAVLLETRATKNMFSVMLHFAAVLGPQWPIIFYTFPSTADYVRQSAPLSRLEQIGQLQIRVIDNSTTFENQHVVSDFLEQVWFWKDLAPYKHLLLFQLDSIICSASSARVDDFIHWDFIGAPIDEKFGHGYNGGLSLRNRELMVDILVNPPVNTTELVGYAADFEDQFYVGMMKYLPHKSDGSPGANLPNTTEALRFASETIWAERPLGYHQPDRHFQGERLKQVREYCPEIFMLSQHSYEF